VFLFLLAFAVFLFLLPFETDKACHKGDGVVICGESVKCTTSTPPANEGGKPLHFASPSRGSSQAFHCLLPPGLIYCQLNQRSAMTQTPRKRTVTRRLMTRGLGESNDALTVTSAHLAIHSAWQPGHCVTDPRGHKVIVRAKERGNKSMLRVPEIRATSYHSSRAPAPLTAQAPTPSLACKRGISGSEFKGAAERGLALGALARQWVEGGKAVPVRLGGAGKDFFWAENPHRASSFIKRTSQILVPPFSRYPRISEKIASSVRRKSL
jgi:hypothetical protein